METLEGRVAVVTGAARGIGRGLAEVLGERGVRVVACEDLDQLAEWGEHSAALARGDVPAWP